MNDIPEPDRLAGYPHPRERERLIGHRAAEGELLQALAVNKLAHGWIFAGPQGIGKATLAYRFARFLLRHPKDAHRRAAKVDTLAIEPDDPVFQRIAAQADPDLFVLRRSWDQKAKRLRSELRAEEVRKVSRFFARTAGGGGYRVCIIDTADDMNTTAANALLKVLEEPPANSLFLLISNMPGRLLTTIRSRCRLLRLAPLDAAEMTAGLGDLGGGKFTGDEIRASAHIASGSLGRALTLLGGDGLKLHAGMMELLNGLPHLDRPRLFKLAGDLAVPKAREEYRLFCSLLVEWLARAARRAVTGETAGKGRGDGEMLDRLGFASSPHVWARCWQHIAQAMRQAEIYNLDRRQVIVNAFLELEEAARASAPRAA